MIQQFLNMMFTLMMARFMLNDVPHYLFEEVTMRTLRVKRVEEEEYATPSQLRYIAILSAKLKIPEPVVKYKGEAGLMIRHLEAELKGRKKLKSGNPAPTGTCYPDAWRFLMRQDEGYLIHGSVQLSAEGPRVKHAWYEFPSGVVWEPQTSQYFKAEDFKMLSPIEERRYDTVQAVIMLGRTGKHGPWSEEERKQWLRSRNPTQELEAITLGPEGPFDFYHVTQAAKVDRIMAEGLKPPIGPQDLAFAPWIIEKELGRKEFFPAIYLWGDDSDAHQFIDFLYKQEVTKESLAILRVDLRPGDVIYADPDTPFIMVSSWMFFGIVPPGRISLIGKREGGKLRWL